MDSLNPGRHNGNRPVVLNENITEANKFETAAITVTSRDRGGKEDRKQQTEERTEAETGKEGYGRRKMNLSLIHI